MTEDVLGAEDSTRFSGFSGGPKVLDISVLRYFSTIFYPSISENDSFNSNSAYFEIGFTINFAGVVCLRKIKRFYAIICHGLISIPFCRGYMRHESDGSRFVEFSVKAENPDFAGFFEPIIYYFFKRKPFNAVRVGYNISMVI
jgi:hypothetical protein